MVLFISMGSLGVLCIVLIGASTYDVNDHLNYVTAAGIDVWNSDLEHVIDIFHILLNQKIKISGIKLVSSKMLWLLNFLCFCLCMLWSSVSS